MQGRPLRIPFVVFGVGVGILCLDFFLKSVALRSFPPEETVEQWSVLTLAVHRNPGIAFDLPVSLSLLFPVTVVILLFLVRYAKKERKENPLASSAALVVILGAIGNLWDRIWHGFTTDYFILFGHSAINLSDVLILTGILLLLWVGRPSDHPTPSPPKVPKK
ncbi:MAG TPA: signal peptidase II [Patescibacteria group bacterium]|nr:signal peptidase II [Patescibacteria group bacterium]